MGRRVLAGLFLVGALAAQATGTLLVRISDEDLCRRADAVVRAEVLDVESFRDLRRGRVLTNTTLGVLEYLKGAGPDQILVQTAGGTLGELEYRVLGSPTFALGEEVVLFLEARDDANRVIGMAQGKLRVVQGQGAERLLERDLTSVALVDRSPGSRQRIGAHGAPPSRIRLDDLRAIIRRVAPRPGAPESPRPLVPAPYSM